MYPVNFRLRRKLQDIIILLKQQLQKLTLCLTGSLDLDVAPVIAFRSAQQLPRYVVLKYESLEGGGGAGTAHLYESLEGGGGAGTSHLYESLEGGGGAGTTHH